MFCSLYLLLHYLMQLLGILFNTQISRTVSWAFVSARTLFDAAEQPQQDDGQYHHLYHSQASIYGTSRRCVMEPPQVEVTDRSWPCRTL